MKAFVLVRQPLLYFLHVHRSFFFNATATTELYTLSLHDALPICSTAASTPRPPVTSSPPSRSCASRSRRSEEHTSELQSRSDLVCRLLLEKKKKKKKCLYNTKKKKTEIIE